MGIVRRLSYKCENRGLIPGTQKKVEKRSDVIQLPPDLHVHHGMHNA